MWSRAFHIFEMYGMGNYAVYAEHDVIYIDMPELNGKITDEHRKELSHAGWDFNEENGVWEKYV